MPPQRRGVPSFAIILLLHELFRAATTYGIPPVTLGAIAGQIVLYLRIIKLPWDSVWDVCISVDAILRRKKYARLILSQLEHGDDWHLYYNMVSFMWKGRTLERIMGSLKFAITLVVFTLATAITYVILYQLAFNITDDRNYLLHCSVGFSGVIFALKVLTTHYDSNNMSYFMGMPVIAKYAVWFELVYISLISPNASFVGHLAGILVGLAYVYGPLKLVISSLTDIVNSITGTNDRRTHDDQRHSSTFTQSSTHQSNYSSQSSTHQSSTPSPTASSQSRSHRYSTRKRTAFYGNFVPSGMSEEEQLRRAMEESMRSEEGSGSTSNHDSHPSAPPYPSQNTQSNPNPPYPINHNPTPPYPLDNNSHPDYETLRNIRLRKYQSHN